jgi:hypothetical protein
MEKRIRMTSASPKVVLEINGNLALEGWAVEEVSAECAVLENLSLEPREDMIAIRCQEDCSVRVPTSAALEVVRVNGHATLKSLEGETRIRSVAGRLTLRNAGTVHLDRLQGHMTAKNLTGDLIAGTIEGNVTLSDIQGNLQVDSIQGNLTLEDLDGEADVQAQGNLSLHLDPFPGNVYRFRAGGNLKCQLPTDASVEITISEAASVALKLPGTKESGPFHVPYQLTLGGGGARLDLAAQGQVQITGLPVGLGVPGISLDLDEDPNNLADTVGEFVTQQIEAQTALLEQQIEAQLEGLSATLSTSGLTPEQVERIEQRARKASDRASARAQEKLRRSQEKLQRKLEAARRRTERRASVAEMAARDRRRRSEPAEMSPIQPEVAEEPVGGEERLIILQMLEQKQITIDQADQLLAALEGQGAPSSR